MSYLLMMDKPKIKLPATLYRLQTNAYICSSC
jgi:hypothetical protein